MSDEETLYRCWVCERTERVVVANGTLRKPIGWETDAKGRRRCPQHRLSNRTMVTLGDLIAAKKGAAR